MCVGAKRFALFGMAIRGLSRSNPSVGRSPHRQTFRSYFPLRGNPPMERKGYLALIKAWCKTSTDRTVRHPLSAPTRGWLGTQGRSKNSAAPFNPLCGRGLGLVETLVAAGVGAVMLYGVLRVATVSVQTSQVAVTTQAEVELSVILQQISDSANKNSGEMCKKNLKPSRLTNGSLPSAGWLGRLDSSNNLVSNSAILKPGPFRDGLLEIKSLEFRSAGESDPSDWRFFVFYTKPQLGNYETIGDGECDPTATPPKRAGCYFKFCKLERRESAGNLTQCEFKTCQALHISPACSGANEYLQKIKEDGSPECKSMADFCKVGEALTFKEETKSDGTKKTVKECVLLLNPKNPSYDPDLPVSLTNKKFKDLNCGAGKVLLGFKVEDSDGDGNPDPDGALEPDCRSPCTGGRIYKTASSRCECPSGQSWNNVSCL